MQLSILGTILVLAVLFAALFAAMLAIYFINKPKKSNLTSLTREQMRLMGKGTRRHKK